jgi:hypothetical protein
LARVAGWISFTFGGFVFLRGLWDCFAGQPEANHYSSFPWQFVTRGEWLSYAGFEMAYGLAACGLGWVAWQIARRLPASVIR